MTSSNGNIFCVTGPLCGEFTGPGEFPSQRLVMRSFDVFFDMRLNKRLSKQPWGWWFETSSWSLWRQCNVGKDSRKTVRESFKCWDLVRLILETWRWCWMRRNAVQPATYLIQPVPWPAHRATPTLARRVIVISVWPASGGLAFGSSPHDILRVLGLCE